MKNTNKLLTLILAVMMMLCMAVMTSAANSEIEPNNAPNKASLMNTETTYSGVISDYDDEDWYKFTNSKDYFILTFDVDESVDITEIGGGWNIEVYDSTFSLIDYWYSATKRVESPILPYTGTIYVKVWREDDRVIDCKYNLTAKTVSDAHWEKEINNEPKNATVINTNEEYFGVISNDEDTADYYKFTTSDDYFTLNFKFNQDDNYSTDARDGWYVSIRKAGEDEPIQVYGDDECVRSNFTTAILPYSGSFYISVVPLGYDDSDKPIDCYYSIKVNTKKESSWEKEDNNITGRATAVEFDKKYNGIISNGEDKDWYKFSSADRHIKLSFSTSTVTDKEAIHDGWYIGIYDKDGEKIDDLETKVSDNITVNVKGNGYICVAPLGYYYSDRPIDCQYNFKITNVAHTYNSWVTTKKATCKASGTQERTCTLCGGKETKSIAKLTTHTFKDTLTKATTEKDGSIVNKCSVCGKVNSTKTIAKASTVKLSTTSYIYDGKAKTPAVTVADNKGKALKKDTDYTVTYSANKAIGTATAKVTFKGNYSGTKNLTFKILPAKVTGLKASSIATTSIKLTWTKVNGAAGYTVYRYDTATKKYVAIKNVTTTTFTDSGRKAGTNYKYAVKAYKKVNNVNYVSATYPELSTATKTAAPAISKVTAGSKKATVEWKKVSGATGYELYYSSKKDGSFTKVGSTTKLTLTKSGLKSGSTYYFKVRAYKTVGETKLYSGYSTVKSVKVK